jgi:lipopolysaccharide export system protein LptA
MPVSISRLRIWFAVLALLAVAVVSGFYLRARMEMHNALKGLPGKLGIEIQQTSEGFSLSKSEGGRTLFTIHASKATQFKEGGRAELHDVNIVVYGRQSDRFDQIYGSDFEYDQRAGTVVSKGEVFIDLQGNTEGRKVDDQTPPVATQNPIHLRTLGMTFHQQSGLAETDGRVDFGVPEASGTAQGATYDSKKNELTLHSAVDIQTSGTEPTHIQAAHGVISKEPHQVRLEAPQLEGSARKVLADHAVVDLAEDNSIQRIHAMGNVRLCEAGGMRLGSPAAEMKVGANNLVESALFTGGVDFESETQGAGGHSGEMLLHFVHGKASAGGSRKSKAQSTAEILAQSSAQSMDSVEVKSPRVGTTPTLGHPTDHKAPLNQPKVEWATRPAAPPSAHSGNGAKGGGGTALLKTIYASRGVSLQQAPRAASKNPQTVTMTSNAMTFVLDDGRLLTSAQTEAAGQLVMTASAGSAGGSGAGAKNAGERTVIDAQHFTAEFGDENRLRAAHGAGAVVVTNRNSGLPDKVSTSDTMAAQFTPGGEVSRVVQEGNFRYREGQSSPNEPGGRMSFADRATYSAVEDALTLQGSPRVVDGGMTVTADSIRILRHSGEAFAQGNVKTTYSELKVQPNGALLATAEPIHVTARAMNALQSSGLAHYTGGARLWQGSNIVEAPTIDFDQKTRTLMARGDRQRPVNSVFMQVDQKGKASTMLVTAPNLNYADSERQAHYWGGVTAHGQDGVMTSERADVFLEAAASHGASQGTGAAVSPITKRGAGPALMPGSQGPSQLDHIIANTHVLVQQQERRAEGEKLVYTAANGSYVITGGSPLLSDPVNGTVRGDSLTFFSHDDRVVVEGDGSSRAVTHTHVSH